MGLLFTFTVESNKMLQQSPIVEREGGKREEEEGRMERRGRRRPEVMRWCRRRSFLRERERRVENEKEEMK